MTGHRILVRHYHEPGDLHELTFSCYRRMPLITNDVWRKLFRQSIDRGIESWAYRLVVFVLMPEYLHLLVLPTTKVVEVDNFLSAVKLPHSVRIKRILQQNNSPLLKRLTVQERPGKTSFRYWQERPGYDRNLSTERAVLSAIDYIHENPVRRGVPAGMLRTHKSLTQTFRRSTVFPGTFSRPNRKKPQSVLGHVRWWPIQPPTFIGPQMAIRRSEYTRLESSSFPIRLKRLYNRIGTGDPKPSPVAPENRSIDVGVFLFIVRIDSATPPVNLPRSRWWLKVSVC